MSSFPYSRREGVEDFGHDYEHLMTALFSLRFALSKKFEKFWIASNVHDVGDFDDIVMSLTSNTGKKIAFLIQLKHVESTKRPINPERLNYSKKKVGKRKKSNESFSLEKYWEGFDEFQTQYLKSEKMDDVPIIKELRNADNIILVLYTNNYAVNGNYLKKLKLKDDFFDLLDTTDMKHCHGLNHEHEELRHHNSDFLSKLRLFTNQLHAEKVIDLIKTYIRNLLELQFPSMVDFHEVVKQYVEYVKTWIKGYKIREEKVYYTLTKPEVMKILVGILLDTYKYDFSKEHFTSYEDTPKTIWNKIINDKTITLLNKNARVTDFIQSYYGSEVGKYIENPLAVWSELLPEKAVEDFCSEFGHAEVAQVCQNTELSMALIYKTLWMYGTVPLLLHLSKSEYFEDILKILHVCQHSIKVMALVPDVSKVELTKNSFHFVTFQDLSPDQQEIILGVEVSFQGRVRVPLKDFVEKSMHSIIKSHDVIDILGSELVIGGKVGEIYEYFIGRCLSRVLLRYEVLETAHSNFLIEAQNCETAREKLTKFISKNSIINFVSSEEKRREFKSTKVTQHRLNYNDGYLEWVESVGSVSDLRNYQVESHQDEYELMQPETLGGYLTSNRTTRIRVVFGGPGMGKSTLIDFVAYSAPSDLWVLKIKLTDMVVSKPTIKCFSNVEPQPGCSQSSDYNSSDYDSSPDEDYFLSRSFDISKYFKSIATQDETIPTSDISLAVFKKLYQENKILILLDGFDEIPNRYKEKVTEIIVHLKHEQRQVWVTTRTHLKTHLEDKLGVLASSLKPFTHDEQRSYLINYFKANVETSNEDILEKFADRLLIAAKKNLSDRDGQFTGIPLQTKLLAEIFLKQYQTSCKENEVKLLEQFDLLDLYDLFIKKKRNILVNEKFGFNELVVSEASNVEEAQQCFALNNIFGEDTVRKFNMEKKLDRYNEDMKNGILQRGGILVVRDSKNGVYVDFIHRTFAEYFVAKFLSQNFLANDFVRKNVLLLLKERFRKPQEYEFVFRIFDSLRARELSHPLHRLIINMKTDNIEHEMQKNPKAFLKLDEFNRSGLHMLVVYGRGSTRKEKTILPDIDLGRFDRYLQLFEVRDLKLTDCFGYNVLDYCFYFGNGKFAAALCRKAWTLPLIRKRLLYRHLAFQNRNFPRSNRYIIRTMFYNFVVRDLLFGRIHENTLISDCLPNLHLPSESKDTLKAITQPGIDTVSDYLRKIGVKDSKTSKYLDIRFAVAFGSRTNVEELLLSRKIDVNERDANTGDTLLHYASYNGRSKIFELLMDRGADINLTGRKGRTVFGILIPTGQVHLVEKYSDLFLEHREELSEENDDGDTALNLASASGSTGIVKKCLELKMDINEKNRKENTRHLLFQQGLSKDRVCDAKTPHLDYFWKIRKIRKKCFQLKKGVTKKKTKRTSNRDDFWEKRNTHDSLLNHPLTKENDKGDTALHVASFSGKPGIVEKRMKLKMEVNMKNKKGKTLLYNAVKNNKIDTAHLLIQNGANIFLKNDSQDTILHAAARSGNDAFVLQMLNKNLDLNALNDYNQTPLDTALLYGNLSTAELLFSKGAKIDNISTNGRNVLHLAAWRGYDELAMKFLKEGIFDINGKDTYFKYIDKYCTVYNCSPLGYAVNNANTPFHTIVSLVKLFLKAGASVEVQNLYDLFNVVILQIKTQNDLTEALNISKELVNKCSTINDGNIILHEIILKARAKRSHMNDYSNQFFEEYLKLLVNAGADVRTRDEQGKSVCDLVSEDGLDRLWDIFNGRWSFQHEEDLTNQSEYDAKVLHQDYFRRIRKIRNKSFELKKGVIKKGSRRNTHGYDFWEERNTYDLLSEHNLTEENDKGSTALHVPSFSGKTGILEKRLKLQMEVNMKNKKGNTLLYNAVKNNKIETAQLLIQHGADVFLKNDSQDTILHAAARSGNNAFVLQMLNENLDLNALNDYNQTPLYMALFYDNLSTAELLLSKGAKIDNISTNGRNVLHLAAWRGYDGLAIKFLKEGIFDINGKDQFNLSPLGYAIQSGSSSFHGILSLVMLFLNAGASVKVRNLCDLFDTGISKINAQTDLTQVLDISKELANKCSNINKKNILHEIIMKRRERRSDMNEYSLKFFKEYFKVLVSLGADGRIRDEDEEAKSIYD